MRNLGGIGMANGAFKRRVNRPGKRLRLDDKRNFFALPFLFEPRRRMARQANVFGSRLSL
jgi:hypothetical protein